MFKTPLKKRIFEHDTIQLPVHMFAFIAKGMIIMAKVLLLAMTTMVISMMMLVLTVSMMLPTNRIWGR